MTVCENLYFFNFEHNLNIKLKRWKFSIVWKDDAQICRKFVFLSKKRKKKSV